MNGFSSLVLLLAGPSPPQSALRDELATLVEAFVAEERPLGLAGVVLLGEETVWAHGRGAAQPGERAILSADTKLPVDFLAGHLAGVALLARLEEFELELDDPLTRLVSELSSDLGEVRLAHLLGHSSGLSSCEGWLAERARAGAGVGPADLRAWLAEQALEFTPGSCVSFSATNDLLVAQLLERAAQRPLVEVLAQWLQAGLSDASLELAVAAEPGVELERLGRVLDGRLQLDAPRRARAGELRLAATAHDLARYARALGRGELLAGMPFRAWLEARFDAGHETRALLTGLTAERLGPHSGWSLGGVARGVRTSVTWHEDLELAIALLAWGEDVPLERLAQRMARRCAGIADPGLRDMVLSKEELRTYVGSYLVACTSYDILESSGRLRVMPADGEPFDLQAQGEHRFVARHDHELSLLFRVKAGRAFLFELDSHGAVSIGKRVD